MISLLMAATIAANPCMVPHHHKAGAPAALMLLLLGLIIWKDKP